MSTKNINYTRLVQRLHAPSGQVDAPFSRLTGFTANAREILGQLFTCDYMGSSEFEWGTVPKALQTMVKGRHRLITDSLEISVTPNEWEVKDATRNLEVCQADFKAEGGRQFYQERLTRAEVAFANISNPQPHPIYVIAPRPLMTYAKTFIAQESVQKHGLQEPTRLRESFIEAYAAKNVGWFELDNGFMFFSDHSMFDRVAQAFDLKHRIPGPIKATPMRPEGGVADAAPVRACG